LGSLSRTYSPCLRTLQIMQPAMPNRKDAETCHLQRMGSVKNA
jgi:hypothetical protein